MTYDELAATGLIQTRAPRYTSYPPATVFAPTETPDAYQAQLAGLDPAEPVSLYVHIPFCERLCWFCACRTQGVRSLSPVIGYVETLLNEITLLARHLPPGIQMGRLHFGGGTPTILSPELIAKVTKAIDTHFTRTEDFEFSVEIDPTLVNEAKINAFATAGMTRASIGVQDFEPRVQAAIGREQSFETTRTCVAQLRAAGITSLNIDLVYGLPFQTKKTLADTLAKTMELAPDRLSLFGYAHVPHMAKRQRLIPEEALPGDRARFALFTQASDTFQAQGYLPIGIDHFALPGDSLVEAARTGGLRRNFQGYTDDACPTLLGLGASSISRVGGYFQNAPRTADYARNVANGTLPIARRHTWTSQDRLRGRMIEMLLCEYGINFARLRNEFPSLGSLQVELLACTAKFGDIVRLDETGFWITPGSEPLVRAVAQFFDAYKANQAIYSRVS